MANVVYTSLSSLSPISLKYQYYRNESLVSTVNTYKNGYNVSNLQSLANYQDIAINKSSCFVLTTAVNLSSIFTSPNQINIGALPTSVLLQPRTSTGNNYITFTGNGFSLLPGSGNSIFYISPIVGTNQVNIAINNRYLQVDINYPYNVTASSNVLDPNNTVKQSFNVIYQNNTISFYTLTNSGYRYLSFNNTDNTMRATGVVLNNIAYNDYVFNCVPVTNLFSQQGFNPTNDWVTYYFESQTGTNNKTVDVYQDINQLTTNLLIDFPTEIAIDSGVATINIANLKTNVTPAGNPAPVNNTYYPTAVITTN
jgi:hypothetical protein